jgi:alpha-L-fucosidase
VLSFAFLLASLQGGDIKSPLPVPTRSQREWQDLGIGVFFHFAPNTFNDKEEDDLTLPLPQFDPDKLDVNQWVDAASAVGAKYVVLVAKHAGGFCLWPTKTTRYSIAATPYKGGKGDIVAEVSGACARRHIKFGVYLSPTDASQNAGGAGRTRDPKDQARYSGIYRQQLKELLTNYGPIEEVWFDGSQTIEVKDLLARYAPSAMVFQGPCATIRWVGNEDGFAPYPSWNTLAKRDADTGVATAIHGDPNGDTWMPLEVDVSMRRPAWFWHPGDEAHVLSLDSLMSIYYRSVGRGTNLLLNFPPDRHGLVDQVDFQRAKEFGEEIRRRFSHPVGEAHGAGEIVTLTFDRPTRIDHVEIQEDIAKGERIRRHVVEGFIDGAWKELESGTQVGERRLVPVTPSTVRALRFRALEHVGDPAIRRLAAYDTGAAPPTDWAEDAPVWSTDAVGSWTSEGAVSIDLASKLQAAATYRVRLVGTEGRQVALKDPQYMQDGVPWPHVLRAESGRSDVFLLTITAIPKTAVLSGTVTGAGKGSILVQRVQ